MLPVEKFERIAEITGRGVGWLATILVLGVALNVVLRYFFAASQIWLAEWNAQVFAALFLLGGAFALHQNRHVRVDVLYERFSPKMRAWIDLLGAAFLLVPFCWVVMRKAWPFFWRSWQIGERSPEASGLPARYLIKFILFLAFAMLLIQGGGWIARRIYFLRSVSDQTT